MASERRLGEELGRALAPLFAGTADRRQLLETCLRYAASDGKESDGTSYLELPSRLSPRVLLEEVLAPHWRAEKLLSESGKPLRLSAGEFGNLLAKGPEFVRKVAERNLRAAPWGPRHNLPSVTEFISGSDFLSEPSPTPHQARVFNEALGNTPEEWFVTPFPYSCVWLQWGKGSGKDLFSAWVNSYLAYCIARMRCPWFHFRMPFGEVLDAVNVATTQGQAKRTYYSKLERMMMRPCFADLLDQRRGHGINTELVVFSRKVPGYAREQLVVRLHSLNSSNESAEGLNTYSWVMDEADAFRTADGHENANAMFNTLTTSSRTLHQRGLVISYSRSAVGFMAVNVPRCKNLGGDVAEWWGDIAPTWRVLPWKVYLPKAVGTGKERRIIWTNHDGAEGEEPDREMARTIRSDPVQFWAKYGNKPPAVEDAYFDQEEIVLAAWERPKAMAVRPVARVEAYVSRQAHGGSEKPVERSAIRLNRLTLRPGVTYYAGLDGGEKNDSAALALAHVVPAGEQGGICPACWRISERRYAKHYVPEPPPPAGNWRTNEYPCDHCGQQCPATPPIPSFWGIARASGGMIERARLVRNSTGELLEETRLQLARGEDGLWHTAPEVVTEKLYLPLIVVDLLIEWRPEQGRGRTVDFLNVKEVLLQLHETGQLGHVMADRWEATLLTQELASAGVSIEKVALSQPLQRTLYSDLKTALYEQLLLVASDEENPAYSRCLTHLRELRDTGTRIDHPPTSSLGGPGRKDLPDALAIAVHLAMRFGAQPLGWGVMDLSTDPQLPSATDPKRSALSQEVHNLLSGMGL